MKNLKEKRDLLVKQLNYFDDEATKVRKQIDELDHNGKKERMITCVGKCYSVYNNDTNFPHMLYVYGLQEEGLRLKVLSVSYSTQDENYYGCETDLSFDPTDPNKDYMADAVEITKEEFMNHYLVVKERIKKAIKILSY